MHKLNLMNPRHTNIVRIGYEWTNGFSQIIVIIYLDEWAYFSSTHRQTHTDNHTQTITHRQTHTDLSIVHGIKGAYPHYSTISDP